jgi:hypothetical protein
MLACYVFLQIEEVRHQFDSWLTHLFEVGGNMFLCYTIPHWQTGDLCPFAFVFAASELAFAPAFAFYIDP